MYLLTGGSGILGTELQKQAPSFGIKFLAPDSDELNISDKEYVYEYLRVNPSLYNNIHGIVHCAAYTNVPGSETNRFEAINVNINGTENIANVLCCNLGARLIYISTDYVYPGRTGNYKETDFTQPVNFYSLTKLAGEAYTNEGDLVIRTSFKPNEPWSYPKAFDDLYTSADYVDIIAPKILDLIGNNESGIYNVGTERKTIYDLARRRNTKVKPISRKEIKDVYLPSDISMNLDKYNTYYEEQYGCDAPDCCPKQ